MGNGTITMTGAEYDALAGKIATLEAENAKLRAELERRAVPDDHTEQALAMVPDGWKLVPVEPTPEMMKAGCAVPLNKAARHNSCYRAMLAAAPSAPKADDPVKVQLLEALEKIMAAPRRWYGLIVVNEEDEVQARAAIAAARQEGGRV